MRLAPCGLWINHLPHGAKRSYTPFGEELTSSGDFETSFAFTGEMQDASGLLYLRARYLSTETGRFTSADPFSGYLNYPTSMNPYQYGYNNPLRYVDPSGNIVSALLWQMYGADLLSMVSQYANRNCTTVKQLTVNVLAGAAAFTVGVAVGVAVGAIGVALFPGSLLAAVVFGAVGGVAAGQFSRLVSNLILCKEDPTEGLLNPSDMLIEGVLGGLGGAVGYGLEKFVESLLVAKAMKAAAGTADDIITTT